MTEIQKKLFMEAKLAQKNSYAPYSQAHIGSAVLMSNQKIYSGTNVENASYGGTVCAERIALFSAISSGAPHEILEILVVSNSAEPWPPCGMCRQVMAEFATEKTLVHITNLNGDIKTFTFSHLQPEMFHKKYLHTP